MTKKQKLQIAMLVQMQEDSLRKKIFWDIFWIVFIIVGLIVLIYYCNLAEKINQYGDILNKDVEGIKNIQECEDNENLELCVSIINLRIDTYESHLKQFKSFVDNKTFFSDRLEIQGVIDEELVKVNKARIELNNLLKENNQTKESYTKGSEETIKLFDVRYL